MRHQRRFLSESAWEHSLGPRMFATLNASGSKRNALECHCLCTVSATMVLADPTVPLIAPPKSLQTAACQNVSAKATPTQDIPVPIKPVSNTFFLPNDGESAALPHNTDVTTCAAVKLPWRMPAWCEITESGSVESKLRNWYTMYDCSDAICQKSTRRESDKIASAFLFGMLAHVNSGGLSGVEGGAFSSLAAEQSEEGML